MVDKDKLAVSLQSAILSQPYSIQLVRAFFTSAVKQHLPVAVWRLPQTNQENTPVNMIVDFSGKVRKVNVDLEELPKGFVISPFVNQGDEALFIQADVHYQADDKIIISNTLSSTQQENEKLFFQQFQKLLYSEEINQTPYFAAHSPSFVATSKNQFLEAVNQATTTIRQGGFQKVVLSRTKAVQLPDHFDIATTFEKLCKLYPTAFISLVSIPKVGTWMGASPETLISVDKHKIFRTVALAGTQAKGDLTDMNEAQWRQKEIEEQALVSRYIISCFKKIRLREYEETGPRTVAAGNLIHLKTDFEVDTVATHFPQLGTVMLDLLHPTSAVCGMPKAAALDFILKNETHQRDFYSGYLGVVNIEQATSLFVNLRCMQLQRNQAILYAGAGITQGSVPEREWLETEIKCNTMLKALEV